MPDDLGERRDTGARSERGLAFRHGLNLALELADSQAEVLLVVLSDPGAVAAFAPVAPGEQPVELRRTAFDVG